MSSLIGLSAYILCISIAIGSSDTRINRFNHSDLDRTLQTALDAQRYREKASDEVDDHIQNENKNQGLTNTIINHNRKIKNIENKFILIVNNFANSSHVKEVIEKTKQLENHVFGAPRPHSSWREFLLMAIITMVIAGILIKVAKKYLGPWLIRYIQKRSDNTPRVPSISEHVHMSCLNKSLSTDELNVIVEQQLEKQNKKLNEIMHKLNSCQPMENELVVLEE
jgi:hypothetical protein